VRGGGVPRPVARGGEGILKRIEPRPASAAEGFVGGVGFRATGATAPADASELSGSADEASTRPRDARPTPAGRDGVGFGVARLFERRPELSRARPLAGASSGAASSAAG
jgi:hypothetical protein